MSEEGKVCDAPECSNPAVVHLTTVVDNKSTTSYLCKSCAQAKGISTDPAPAVDVSDFLAQLGEAGPAKATASAAEPCSFCEMTFDNFRESGRLGCPHCYTSFGAGMRRLLKRIHGASRHAGKVYLPADPAAADLGRRLDGLRRGLQRAIDAEDFERAAVLRDLIREHETAG